MNDGMEQYCSDTLRVQAVLRVVSEEIGRVNTPHIRKLLERVEEDLRREHAHRVAVMD